MRPRAACTASASPWSTRCRATRSSRWRATSSSTGRASRAGCRPRRSSRARRRPRTGAAPRSPSLPMRRFSARRRGSSRRGSTGWRAPRPICSPGVEIRWKCDPELISDERCPPRRCSSSRAGSPIISSEQIGERETATSTPFTGTPRFPQRPGLGRMGGGLAGLGRRQRLLLLQHHPDPRRRHPRAGPAHRADPRHSRASPSWSARRRPRTSRPRTC